ncbi:MAG: CHRD domain-containing protein [Rubrivivax sp.]|nr:CHRD domain-containing protein [Rubrivivax sp.]MDP3083414.1 CHRD domain-containing protein [Rubrivivax sp.]
MKAQLTTLSALLALAATPMAAHAIVYQFNASLSPSNELHVPTSTASGVATLFFDTSSNTYDFSMAVFGLSGGGSGKAASGAHIHGAASLTENGPVRIDLLLAPFSSLNSGAILLVGGNTVAAAAIPATPASGSNIGYGAMSFLQMLQTGLAYVNVHTTADGAGAVRGQLVQVAAVVPEPSTYLLLLAGLGVVGMVARRRAAAAS